MCLVALCPWVVGCCFVFFFVERGLLGGERVVHILLWTFCAASKSNSAGSGATLLRGSLDQRLCVVPFAGRVLARLLFLHETVAFFLGIQLPEYGNGDDFQVQGRTLRMGLDVLWEGEVPVTMTLLQSSVQTVLVLMCFLFTT